MIYSTKWILQVQNLIERCLQLYMNRDEVVKTLLTRARIDPGFTTLGKYLETYVRVIVLTFICSFYVIYLNSEICLHTEKKKLMSPFSISLTITAIILFL